MPLLFSNGCAEQVGTFLRKACQTYVEVQFYSWLKFNFPLFLLVT